MLTPADKVLASPRGNDIVQVVITRSCDIFNCSNCTQLLPFRRDEREMSLECVEEALLSLADWPGVVACFGGNPCTHSRFPEVCELWRRHVHPQERRGLWTNHLARHGQVAKDTFWPRGRFNLNVHGNEYAANVMRTFLPGIRVWGERPSTHGAVLGSHADLGVSEDEWLAARERCDINQRWSAGIYQRGVKGDGAGDGRPHAYFCEVAGAIDGVTGENNGIPAVPGWWREPMARYQAQVERCCDRHCVVPLRGMGHLDNAGVYDVTPSTELLTVGYKGRVRLESHTSRQPQTHELTDYIGLRR